MDHEYFKKWVKAAGMRAIKTISQTAIAGIGTATVMGQVDIAFVASSSLLAGVVSLFMSIAGLPELKMPELPDNSQK